MADMKQFKNVAVLPNTLWAQLDFSHLVIIFVFECKKLDSKRFWPDKCILNTFLCKKW